MKTLFVNNERFDVFCTLKNGLYSVVILSSGDTKHQLKTKDSGTLYTFFGQFPDAIVDLCRECVAEELAAEHDVETLQRALEVAYAHRNEALS